MKHEGLLGWAIKETSALQNYSRQDQEETLNVECEEDDAAEEAEETTEADDKEEAKAERKAQIDEGNRQENLRLRTLLVDAEVTKAKNDGNSLLELHKTDPKIAEAVAKKLGYDSYDEVMTVFEKGTKGEGLNDQKPESSEKDFENWYQKRKTEETHSEAMVKADKLLSKIKDEELQKEAKVYFDKISKGKQLTIDEAEEFADMATLYVNKDNIKSERLSRGLADLASTGVGTSKRGKVEEEQRVVGPNGKMVLLDSNNQK